MDERLTVEKLWRRHRQWSMLADQSKKQITFWRSLTLTLSVCGALFQTMSATIDVSVTSKTCAVIGAAALVMVPFSARHFLAPEQVRNWLRARSVSEGLKSLVYRFLAGVSPYDGLDRVEKLEKAGNQVESWVESMAVELAAVKARATPAPGPLDATSYVTNRVTKQIEKYYRPKARLNAKRAKLFRRLELASSGAAALLGAVATALQLGGGKGGAGAWVGVLTTASAAITSHAAANRYEQQARVYFSTARRLEDLRDEWERKDPQANAPSWAAFVTACEEAISAENRGWMAKLDPEEKAVAVPVRASADSSA